MDEIVITSNPGEEFSWREKTPEEKFLSKLPQSAQKGAEIFINAVHRKHGIKPF